jgi:NAD-dependent deacetylase
MLVLGSSLLVQPAAQLPYITARNGGHLIIVNNAPTPLDRIAKHRYSDLKTFFERVGELAN